MRFISKTKLIIFSIIICSFIPCFAYAAQTDLKVAEQNEILQSINLKQNELDELSNRYTEALLEQEKIKNEIENINIELEKLNNKIENKRKKLEEECKDIYKIENICFLDVFLNSSDFNSFINNVNFYQRFINQTNNTLLETQQLKKEKEEQKVIQESKQEKLSINIQKIENDKKSAEDIINDLQNQYQELDQEIMLLFFQEQLGLTNQLETIDYNVLNTSNLEEFYQAIAQIQSENLNNNISSDYNDIISRAYSMLGTSYAWGGTTSAGFDCSGFVSYCLTGEEGTRLGTTATFAGWNQVSDPQPGDVCVIHNGNSQHTGIYIGNGNMIHAATYGVGVIESPVQDGMIYVRYE